MIYYLAGPMSGVPHFNIPLFDEAAKKLRGYGLNIISPAELDTPAVRAEALASATGKIAGNTVAGETWGDMLARDVKVIADKVQGIILLPGWEHSRGARLEVFVGLLTSKEFSEYCGYAPYQRPLSRHGVRSILQEHLP